MARKRRGHGEGSIYQRKKDGLWCGAITVGRGADGRLKRRYVYGQTRKEVQEALTRLLADQQQGLPIDVSKQMVGEFLVRWLEDVAKTTLRPKTIRSYEQIIRVHLVPAIGHLRLSKLSPQDLQRLYREKRQAGLTHTVRLCHAVLHRALGQAMRWGLVPRNVADVVTPPGVQRREMRALTPEEAARFLDAAQGDRLHALYVLAVTCGLRQAELCGLKWEDIDLEAGTVHVRRQLQWTKGGYYFSEPKSAKSKRVVALPQDAVSALKKHRAKQAAERLALGDAWQDTGLVFTTEVGTPIHPSNLIRRSFRPLLEKAGLPPIRFHDLRHTAASLLIAAGEHLKVVQETLGHSSITLTADTYGHISLAQQKQAAAKMDAILSAARARMRDR